MKYEKPVIFVLLIVIGLMAASMNKDTLGLNLDNAEINRTITATNTAGVIEESVKGTEIPSNNPDITNDNLAETVLPDNDIMYPDLVLADPEQVVILTDETTRNLQFDTAFANLGEGDLYLYGVYKDIGYDAVQVLYTSTGQEYSVNIGEFQLKEEHEHWHLANFANYELWSIDTKGRKDQLMVSSIKVSFCIWDYKKYTENYFEDFTKEILPKARRFPKCDYDLQGLTVGWYDLYDAFTFGQSIDILEVPDGKYILRTLINVENDVIESNYDNNESNIYIEINGKFVKIFITNYPR